MFFVWILHYCNIVFVVEVCDVILSLILSRITALLAVCMVQAWMMWNFIHFHLRLMRERQAEIIAARKKAAERKSKKGRKEDCEYQMFKFSIAYVYTHPV